MSTMSNSTHDVILIANDNVSFTIPVTVANLSVFIRTITDDCIIDNEEIDPIPMIRINSKVLSMVIEFMQHYHTEPMLTIKKPLITPYIGDVVQTWYASFIENVKNKDMLYDIINAANYMHIQPLLDLSCAMTALIIREKSISEIHNELYIEV